jgi:hypothetical protein
MPTLPALDAATRRALLGFSGIGALLMAPVWQAPRTTLLGHPDADIYNHLWGFSHVARSLSAGTSPLNVQSLGWPQGGQLWFIDSFSAVLTLPLQWVLGPVLALNLWTFLLWVFAGVAAWALARRLTGSEAGAWVAGVGFATMPHLLSTVHNGITELLAVGWVPLSGLLAIRLAERPCRRRGIALGAALAGASFSSWYLGAFSLLLVAGMALVHVRQARPERRARLLRVIGWPAGVVLVLVAPVAHLFLKTLQSADGLVHRDPGQVARTLAGHDMVDLLSLIVPGAGPDRRALFDEALRVDVYVGGVLLALAIVGGLRVRSARPWLAGAFCAAVLSLGAWLFLNGAFLMRPGGSGVPLPFLALSQVPGLSSVSHAYRFAVLTQICLCLAAAHGMAWAATRLSRTAVVALVVALGVDAVMAGPTPFVTSSVESPVAYAAIQGEGAVLDLPVGVHVLARGRYAMYQLGHGRPIPYALDDPTPAWLLGNALTRSLIDLERTSVDTVAPVLPSLELALGRHQLVTDGVAAIVVHTDLYPEAMQGRILEFLDITIGEGEVVGQQVVFSL